LGEGGGKTVTTTVTRKREEMPVEMGAGGDGRIGRL